VLTFGACSRSFGSGDLASRKRVQQVRSRTQARERASQRIFFSFDRQLPALFSPFSSRALTSIAPLFGRSCRGIINGLDSNVLSYIDHHRGSLNSLASLNSNSILAGDFYSTRVARRSSGIAP